MITSRREALQLVKVEGKSRLGLAGAVVPLAGNAAERDMIARDVNRVGSIWMLASAESKRCVSGHVGSEANGAPELLRQPAGRPGALHVGKRVVDKKQLRP